MAECDRAVIKDEIRWLSLSRRPRFRASWRVVLWATRMSATPVLVAKAYLSRDCFVPRFKAAGHSQPMSCQAQHSCVSRWQLLG